MREFLRIFSRNTMLLFAAAVIINAGLFLLSCSSERDITLTGDELSEYIEAYPAYLEKTRNESAALSALPMYRNGFAAENVRKTAQAYAALEGVAPVYGDNRGAVLLLQYGLSDLFLLGFLAMVAVVILRERRNGLSYMVRSTAKGRGTLFFHRAAILAFAAFTGAAALSLGNILAMLIAFGDAGLSRPLQSLPEFMQCPYSITIGGYFALSVVIRAAGCFAAAMIFFLLISLLGNAAAYILAAALTAAELLLYHLIPAVSSANALKYVNMFMLIRCEGYFSGCRFLNVFGKAVPALGCALVFLAVLAAALVAAGYFIHSKCYVTGRNFLGRISEPLGRLKEKLSVQHTLFGWESSKILIKRGGAFFFAASFALAMLTALQYGYFYPVDEYDEEWYEKYGGEITAENVSLAENDLAELYEKEAKLTAQIAQARMEGRSESNIITLEDNLSRTERRRMALEPIFDNMRGGIAYTESTGSAVLLIKPYAYDLFFRRDRRTARRGAFFILIGIIGGITGIYAADRQSNMRSAIRSAYRGRAPVNISKLSVTVIFCALLSLCVNLIQMFRISGIFDFNDLSAPLQSLDFMREFPIFMSIREYIVLLFAVRMLSACVTGLVCALISRLCPDVSSAMGAGVFALAVPSVFAEAVPVFSCVSAVWLMSGEGLMGA